MSPRNGFGAEGWNTAARVQARRGRLLIAYIGRDAWTGCAMLAVMSYPTGADSGISDVEVKVLGTVGLQYAGVWYSPPTGLMRASLAALALAGGEINEAGTIKCAGFLPRDSPPFLPVNPPCVRVSPPIPRP